MEGGGWRVEGGGRRVVKYHCSSMASYKVKSNAQKYAIARLYTNAIRDESRVAKLLITTAAAKRKGKARKRFWKKGTK